MISRLLLLAGLLTANSQKHQVTDENRVWEVTAAMKYTVILEGHPTARAWHWGDMGRAEEKKPYMPLQPNSQ